VHVVRWSIQEVGDATLETVVRCGPDGLDAEYWIDGETVEPETAGVATTALGKTYHRVVAAVDGEGVDYLFDGGWWVEDPVDGTCEPYESPIWDDYLDGGSSEVTEVLWGQLDLRDLACPFPRPGALDTGSDDDLDTCTVDFDYVRRAELPGHAARPHAVELEIGFDCGPFGLGEVWYVVDGVFVANDYYHPPEFGLEQYEEWALEPMRARYGDTVYDYRARAVEVDGEVFIFDVGRVRYDWNLEAALGMDNCALVDWSPPLRPTTPHFIEGATPGQLVWQTGWMVDAGLLGPECAGYSTCGTEVEYWEASGRDLGLMFWLTSEPTTPVVLDITWDPTEVSLGAAAGGCADTSQTDTSETLRVTIEPDDWPLENWAPSMPAGMLTFATSGAGDGIADGDQVTEVRVTVVDELSDPAYHDADDLVLTVTTVDRPDGAICH